MGIKFTQIADEDRDFISAEAVRHLQRTETKTERGEHDGGVSQNAA
jgi:hypothetical protein